MRTVLGRRGSIAAINFLPILVLTLVSLWSGYSQPVRSADTAERDGKALVADLLSRAPSEPSTNTGLLRVQNPGRSWREIPFSFAVVPSGDSWVTLYVAVPSAAFPGGAQLKIVHSPGKPNQYELLEPLKVGVEPRKFHGNETMIAFAGSDFWVADLGLEFFHWPNQKVLRTEMRRGQMSRVLESTNPKPAPGAYARVVSWIDIDSGGIVHADAYDSHGNELKRFDPKSFHKVEGQWQLREMEIRNIPARTRSEIIFDKPPAN